MSYRVEVTDQAYVAIRQYTRYIAVECESPLNAARWLEKVWDAVDSLERWPRRCPLAPEDQFRPYEIRMRIVGDHLLLFTVDNDAKAVWVIGFRHGHRLPRSGELPDQPPGQ